METESPTPQPAPPTPFTAASPGISPDTLLRLRYDALMRQLGGARSAQARYEARLLSWLVLSGGVLLGVYIVGSTLFPALVTLLPFIVIACGIQAAFILNNLEFARFCAAALEARLNQLLESNILITARLEEDFFRPLNEAPVYDLLARPDRAHVAFALQWLCVWLFFFAAGALEAWRVVPDSQRLFYFSILMTWAGISAIWLWTKSTARHAITSMEQVLRDVGSNPPPPPATPPVR